MNLYDLHAKPESLHRHADMDTRVPKIFWPKYKDNPAELKKREDAISTDAHDALANTADVLKAPWPKGEAAISTVIHRSRQYKDFLKTLTIPK